MKRILVLALLLSVPMYATLEQDVRKTAEDLAVEKRNVPEKTWAEFLLTPFEQADRQPGEPAFYPCLEYWKSVFGFDKKQEAPVKKPIPPNAPDTETVPSAQPMPPSVIAYPIPPNGPTSTQPIPPNVESEQKRTFFVFEVTNVDPNDTVLLKKIAERIKNKTLRSTIETSVAPQENPDQDNDGFEVLVLDAKE